MDGCLALGHINGIGNPEGQYKIKLIEKPEKPLGTAPVQDMAIKGNQAKKLKTLRRTPIKGEEAARLRKSPIKVLKDRNTSGPVDKFKRKSTVKGWTMEQSKNHKKLMRIHDVESKEKKKIKNGTTANQVGVLKKGDLHCLAI